MGIKPIKDVKHKSRLGVQSNLSRSHAPARERI